jgi:hypothetical protein
MRLRTHSTHLILIVVVVGIVLGAGCTEVDTSDYRDAPPEIRDGTLDYQDYKDSGCPYLGDTLDHETMQACNEWIQNTTATKTPRN